MTKTALTAEFKKRYGLMPDEVFFCPGRVNLIGEHLDYNGGDVMPFAISLGSYLAISKNKSGSFRFASLDFPEFAEMPVQTSYSRIDKYWYNYPLGIINELLQDGYRLGGADMLFYGNLPVAAGLSSSASIEVLTGFAFSQLFGPPISNKQISLLAKKVENEFIGLSCGIMDQFAVAMGKKDHVILLNCDTIEYEYLKIQTGDYLTVIINSRKQRSLSESKYNERYDECQQALKLLKQELPINNLCDTNLATFIMHSHLIADPIILKRATHVITENARVRDTRKALQEGDLNRVGELLYESHDSLQYLYEVSGKELDTIVEFSKTFPDCIGARMTGAGFGGCAIALVKKQSVSDYSEQLIKYYTEKIGYAPSVFGSDIGDGVRVLD